MSNKREPHNPFEGNRPEVVFDFHEGVDEQISIIIVHRDRPEYLNILLQSICVCSTSNNYEIIVVDNGSESQDARDFLDQLDASREIKVIRNQKNEYWSPAANRGASAANKNSKYFIFMHCDVVVLNPAWMDLLVNAAEANNSGMVGVDLASWKVGGTPMSFPHEYCLLLTRKCWEDAGPWSEQMPQVGPALVLMMSAISKGYKPHHFFKNNIVHHYKNFSLNTNEYERFLERAQHELPKLIRNSRPIA